MQVVEGRLFSEGLHTLGQAPDPDKTRSYLAAYFGDRLPETAIDQVSHWDGEDLEGMRQRLERSLQQVSHRLGVPCAPFGNVATIMAHGLILYPGAQC